MGNNIVNKVFFTSDLHLGHTNIIRYCKRPFKSIEHMNNTLIKKWNNTINPNDTVFHVGDFCIRSVLSKGQGSKERYTDYLKRLNGNILLIRGNHDKNNGVKTKIESLVFSGIGGNRINVVHDPKYCSFNHDLNIVGHVHEKWLFKKLTNKSGKTTIAINCGVDVWNFTPVTEQTIFNLYKKIKQKLL